MTLLFKESDLIVSVHVCVVDGVFILSQVVQCCAGTSYAESLNIPKLVDKYPNFRRKITYCFLFFCCATEISTP